jgi:site-specific recombinase XerD
MMEKITELAGLEPTGGWHRLRHTYCSRLADRGVAPTAIQKLARHKTFAVTARYVHLDGDVLKDAIRSLSAPPRRAAGN